MTSTRIAFVLGLAYVAACGSSDATNLDRTGGAGGLAAGGGAAFSCAADQMTLIGVPVTAAGCLDTETKVVMGCAAQGSDDFLNWLFCAQSPDGARYWSSSLRKDLTLPDGWSYCVPPGNMPFVQPPVACFAASCALGSPMTLCSESDTKLEYQCGDPNSVYDAGCCHRTSCKTTPCPTGQQCLPVFSNTYLSCWNTLHGHDVSFVDGGPQEMLCF